MSYIMTKTSPTLVAPATPTPLETLSLSSIDRTMLANVYMDNIFVYTHGEQPAARIKDAFSKALVHYYPIAGRISKDMSGEPVIECTGEGIWFVEATINCTLADVNYLERPLMIPKQEMFPTLPGSVKLEDQILMAQITEFICGGFSVGISHTHYISDAQGTAQFLKAVGEIARGLPEPTVKPLWCRESIPNPPKGTFNSTPSFTIFNPVTLVVDIPDEYINNTKEKFTAETGKKCSSFEVITALVFKSRVKVIKLEPNAEVNVAAAANTRHLLHDVLPSVEGYYGNCLYPYGITKTSEEINNASLVDVIKLLKDAKEAISKKFLDWMNGGSDAHSSMPLGYGTLMVSDCRWVGFNEVDYGWGKPKDVFSVNDHVNHVGVALYFQPPVLKKGIRLLLRCVEEKHVKEFVDELQKKGKFSFLFPKLFNMCNMPSKL